MGKVEEETAYWKIYRNESYGVSFRHPLDWDVIQLEDTIIIAPKAVIEWINQMREGFEGGIFLTMSINKSSKEPVYASDEDSQVIVTKDVVIGNLKAKEYTRVYTIDLPGIPKGSEIVTEVVKYRETFYIIDLLNDQYRKTFYQILSAFRFLADETANWKTYDLGDITFQLPEGWWVRGEDVDYITFVSPEVDFGTPYAYTPPVGAELTIGMISTELSEVECDPTNFPESYITDVQCTKIGNKKARSSHVDYEGHYLNYATIMLRYITVSSIILPWAQMI